MTDVLKYKNYVGSAEVDVESNLCHGKLLFIRDVVVYSAESPRELRVAFESAVDDYLETCAELDRKPETTCNGSFNVRISPEMHMEASLVAGRCGISLNALIKDAISARIGSPMVRHEHEHKLTVEISGGWQDVVETKLSADGGSTWSH